MNRPIALAALAVALLLPAAAEAKTIRHAGALVGSADSKVTLRLTRHHGAITELDRFKASGVIVNCDGGDYLISFEALLPVAVAKTGSFHKRLKNPDGSVLRITGTVKDGGRRTVGNLKTNEFTSDDGHTCTAPRQRFATRALLS